LKKTNSLKLKFRLKNIILYNLAVFPKESLIENLNNSPILLKELYNEYIVFASVKNLLAFKKSYPKINTTYPNMILAREHIITVYVISNLL